MTTDDQLARELRDALQNLHGAAEAHLASAALDRESLVRLARHLGRTSLLVDQMWRTLLEPDTAMEHAPEVDAQEQEVDLRHQLKLAIMDLELAREECRNASNSDYTLNVQLLESCLGNASREVERLMQCLIAEQRQGCLRDAAGG